MKKEITFFELLQMMKDGNAPDAVMYHGERYANVEEDYLLSSTDIEKIKCGVYLSTAIGKSQNMGAMLENEMIEFDVPVLTDKEREYLSAVLKPYKGRVRGIVLYLSLLPGYEYITVRIASEAHQACDSMQFPYFAKGTMYAGMDRGKTYTPSELGLWEKDA